jgi:hypothetical protein
MVIAIAITTIATAIPAIPAADIKKDSATWQSLFLLYQYLNTLPTRSVPATTNCWYG